MIDFQMAREIANHTQNERNASKKSHEVAAIDVGEKAVDDSADDNQRSDGDASKREPKSADQRQVAKERKQMRVADAETKEIRHIERGSRGVRQHCDRSRTQHPGRRGAGVW